jgi:predicted O-linked N-acetylglucosamine transferase (SPINDLY family)
VLRRLLADALIASGRRAERRGRLAQACGRYRTAAALAPRHAAAHLNLGAALEAGGDAAAAEQAYAALLQADPANPYANYNLGRLCYARGALDEAGRLLRLALQGKPEFADALVALANVQEARGDFAAASASLESALALRPGSGGAWYNYGEVLWRLERYDEAEAALRRTLEIEPRLVPAWHLLGNLLRGTSHLGEALEAFAAARRLEPQRFDLESMELLVLTLSDTLSAEELFARHRAFGARLEAAVPARAAPYALARDPERRLRIGYVSCDFKRHPVAWFALPLLERHDRARVEVFCYSTGDRSDEVTGQVRAVADAWRECRALNDAELAELVQRDAIDVLVDLTGHAGAFRLGAFARQPAPVQLSWLGYLHSTGLTRIGYRLTDARADPPGRSDRLHTEKLVRLPHCLWCLRPPHSAAHAVEPPCRGNGYVTFGSFNHAPKLSNTVRRLWAEILVRLPQSRLLLVGIPDGRARADLTRDFAAAGVAATRLTILPRVSFGKYLDQFDAVDIALDTTPYGGGTTTFDALWMGVPVLTLAGERPASRSAASILGALGLEEWIAGSADEYLRLALAHAADPDRIAALRGCLRRRLQASPLMDEARFARDVEAVYRELWRAWCGKRIT